MARKIIILESRPVIAGEVAFRWAMWADVPQARQIRYANDKLTSAVADVTGPELAALQSGAIVEKVEDARWPAGTGVAAIQAFLVARFAAYQAEITAANPWQRYGTNWDGTSWNMVNNG